MTVNDIHQNPIIPATFRDLHVVEKESVGRFCLLIFVIAFVVGLCMFCGMTLLESVLIFVLGVLWLNFMMWMMCGFKPRTLRFVLFWWLSVLLDKPELLYPDLDK